MPAAGQQTVEEGVGPFAGVDALHHEVYQHFARHLLANPDTASDAVQRALAASWTQALAGHRTTAIAWEALTHRIQRAYTPASALYALVPAAEADAAVLHRVLGLSITATADTIGTETITVASLLATFDRRLAGENAAALRACWQAATHRCCVHIGRRSRSPRGFPTETTVSPDQGDFADAGLDLLLRQQLAPLWVSLPAPRLTLYHLLNGGGHLL
ncbi:hypothetical protein ABR737_41470 [Streptomyces sp. Edi2]|uniref:hypothetical protein n=1 Tax=Streptomyces sp. Edi2 TaxID=3162528 RepID=UPI003305C3A2